MNIVMATMAHRAHSAQSVARTNTVCDFGMT